MQNNACFKTVVLIVCAILPYYVEPLVTLSTTRAYAQPQTSVKSAAMQIMGPMIAPKPLAIAGQLSRFDFVVLNNDQTATVRLGNGDGTFGSAATLAVGSSASSLFADHSVAVADFNGDGKADIAVCDQNNNTVSILLGNGDGTFQSRLTTNVVSTPISIASADFNQDGRIDLAVATDVVKILLGNGNGTFTVSTLSVGATPRGVLVVDLNGDGRHDVVTANLTPGTLSVALGNGNGTFGTVQTVSLPRGSGSRPLSLAAADFDDDNLLDLAVAGSDTNAVFVMKGDGTGGFSTLITLTSGILFPVSVAATDINKDGRPDVVVVNNNPSQLVVRLNNGSGSFASPQTINLSGGVNSVALADFSGDGNLDALVSSFTGDNVAVLRGNGDGTFTSLGTLATGNGPMSIAIGDFNNDRGTFAADKLGIDEDVVTSGFGFSGGTSGFSWFNQLTPMSYPITLVSARVRFEDGIAGGTLFTLAVYADPENNGPENGQTPDRSQVVSVIRDADNWSTFVLNSPLTINSGSFVVGVIDNQTSGQIFPATFNRPGLSQPPGSRSFESSDSGVTFRSLFARGKPQLYLSFLIRGGVTTPDTTPPAAPTGLITTAGDLQVSLSWTANTEPDLAYYLLYRSTTNGFTPTAADSIARIAKPTTTFTNTGLTGGTTYYYRLAAVDSTGNKSSPSSQVSATPTTPTSGDTWTTKASMPTARWHSGAGVVNGVLYVAGGYNGGHITPVEAYNFTTNTWTSKASRPSVQTTPASGVVNGILYTAGGTNTSVFITDLWAYNPANDTWTQKASMSVDRSTMSGGVINGLFYAAGGNNFSGVLSLLEAYNPTTNTWTTKAPMPTARASAAAGVVNGILYVVGGSSGIVLPTVEAYNPTTNTWTTKASMPTARNNLSVEVVNGILYAIGGHNGSSPVATVEAYDPTTNTWTTKTSMPTARSGLEAVVYNSLLYAVGGWIGVNTPVGTLEAYTPVGGGPVSDTTPPAIPTSLIATAGDQQVSLSWTANTESDLAYYVLYRSTTNGFTPTAADSIARIIKPTTTFTNTGLTNGTTYYYRLAAVDSSGNKSSPSSQVSATPHDLTPPATPTGLTATAGDLQVSLSWTANTESDLAYCVLYRSTTNGFTPTAADSIARIIKPTTTFTNTGLTNGTTYYYRLAAVDNSGNKSSPSTQVSATPTAGQVVGSGGGTVTDASGTALTIPSGALSSNTIITITRIAESDSRAVIPGGSDRVAGIGLAYEFTATPSATFNPAARLALAYTASQLSTAGVTHPRHIRVYKKAAATDTTWTQVAVDSVNTTTGRVFIHLTGFSVYRLAAARSSQFSALSNMTAATSGQTKRVAVALADGEPTSVKLAYRRGGTKPWQQLSMTTTTASTDSFETTIPATDVTDHGLDLYVKATDGTGTSDSTVVSALRVALASLSSGSAITLPQATTGDTSQTDFKQAQKSNFRMLSIPIALDGNRSASSVLGSQLGIGDIQVGRIFKWNGSSYSEATSENLDPGKAFWVITKTPPSALTLGSGQSSPTTVPPSIAINANGATQIGVPYTFAVPYDSIRAHNSTLDSRAWLWNGGGYDQITTRLEPWKGYWIKSTGSTTSITIPPIDATALPKPLSPVTQPVVPEGWAVRVMAEAGGMTDRYNYAGVTPQATETWDGLDFAEPPPLGAGTVALYFPHPEWSGATAGAYAGDFRPPSAEGTTWDLTVEAAIGQTDAHVTVLDVAQIPSAFTPLLIDLDHYREFNLREQPTVTFRTGPQGSIRHFKLVVGSPAYVAQVKATLVPRAYALEPNYPNPFNPATTIRFALPQAGPVRLAVYNILGQEIRVLLDQVMPAGYHQVVWDGTNRTGQRVASGVYVYAIQAGTFRQNRKMTLVK